MKPPPRTRSRPDRYLKTIQNQDAQGPRTPVCAWTRTEQRKLLAGLKRRYRATGPRGDIDYTLLRQDIPQRSVSEIRSVVDVLKSKVITLMKQRLMKQRREEQRVKKPIELWSDMASAVAGAQQNPIDAAFSQMLLVSSTEPRSLRNSDPPLDHRQTTDQQTPVGRTIPSRPATRPAGQLQSISTTNAAPPLLITKPLPPTVVPPGRLPPPPQVFTTAVLSPKQQQPVAPAPGTSPGAAPSRLGTTETDVAMTVKPIGSNQPQRLFSLPPVSSDAAVAEATTSGGLGVRGAPRPTESPKVLRVLGAATLQPQCAQTDTVATPAPPGPPPPSAKQLSVTPTPEPPPPSAQQLSVTPTPAPPPPSAQQLSITPTPAPPPPSAQQLSITPTPAPPPPSAQQLSVAVLSATPMKSSSSNPVLLSRSSTSIPTNLCSTSTVPPSSVSSSATPSSSSNPQPSVRSSSPSSSTTAEALHAKFGRPSKYAEDDTPRSFGIKCIVDFEKIYCYLSGIHNEKEECALTPMESAILLDLLMSLPEELPLLDCDELQRHMIQVYRCLSAPAASKTAQRQFEDVKPERERDGGDQRNTDSGQTHTGSGHVPGANQDRMDPTSQGEAAAAAAGGGGAVDGAAADGQAEGQSRESKNDYWDMVELCPLNPFMIPLKLLKRQQK